MSKSLERALGPRERLSLRLHLIFCVWCGRYLNQLKFLRQLARLQGDRDPEVTLPSLTLSPEARARIANFIKHESTSLGTRYGAAGG